MLLIHSDVYLRLFCIACSQAPNENSFQMADPPLKKKYPLHWVVYTDDTENLQQELQNPEVDIELLDCRGRTPLMLAVTLGHKECTYILLRAGANADAQNAQMWSISHEVIALKDSSLLLEVIKHRDYQRNMKAAQTAKKFLTMLGETPDFYCEMSWEFSSWLPFVSRVCPSDTYKIYKQGPRVRIDTTLLAFEGTSWKRGNQSFIFSLEDGVPMVTILDHQAKSASRQSLSETDAIETFIPHMYDVLHRLRTPTSTTYLDMDKIGFERSKSTGILSWISNSDRHETIDGYDCKVFDASNVNLVTKIRVDHLTAEEKSKIKQAESGHAFQNILSYIRSENTEEIPAQDPHETGLAASEYLDPDFPLDPDIGRRKEIQKKVNSFKATLWLGERYPLDLQEQILPIVELMSSSSAHFARLQNFMRMQLPAGFPIKIEIPLFHVMSAKITFGNVNAPGPFVTPVEGEAGSSQPGGIAQAVTIEDHVFEIPAIYRNIDDVSWWPDDLTEPGPDQPRPPRYTSVQDQEEMMLQMAIQQSLREAGGSHTPRASPTDDFALPGYYDTEDADLARAIEESLRLSGQSQEASASREVEPPNLIQIEDEDELAKALRLSKEETDRQAREAADAEDELQRVLALSLLER